LSVINKESAEHYKWGNDCDGWHLVKSENLSVIQERVPPNCAENYHYHRKAEQFFFVLSGTATMELNNQVFVIPEQSGIHVPAGAKHRLSNQHPMELIFTVTSTPPSHCDRVEL